MSRAIALWVEKNWKKNEEEFDEPLHSRTGFWEDFFTCRAHRTRSLIKSNMVITYLYIGALKNWLGYLCIPNAIVSILSNYIQLPKKSIPTPSPLTILFDDLHATSMHSSFCFPFKVSKWNVDGMLWYKSKPMK